MKIIHNFSLRFGLVNDDDFHFWLDVSFNDGGNGIKIELSDL